MDRETWGGVLKLGFAAALIGGWVWVQCGAPCEVFAHSETRLLPARCLAYYSQGRP